MVEGRLSVESIKPGVLSRILELESCEVALCEAQLPLLLFGRMPSLLVEHVWADRNLLHLRSESPCNVWAIMQTILEI